MRTEPRTPAPHNARTVRMYEGYARNYALRIDALPDADRRQWLERMCVDLGPGARVLEVGSGTGRDADYLERLGARVDRTDAAQAFLDLQAERRRTGRLLNVITDDLSCPGDSGYDAIVALCVLIHVDRPVVAPVLRKVQNALRVGGLFLASVREGDGDEVSATCLTTQWRPGTFERLVIDASLVIEGSGCYVDSDGDVWRTLLCRRAA